MAYKQPRVPRLHEGGNLYAFVKELVRFLTDFCVTAWNADRLKDEELRAIRERLNALEGTNGDE